MACHMVLTIMLGTEGGGTVVTETDRTPTDLGRKSPQPCDGPYPHSGRETVQKELGYREVRQ